ncbi:hypothetical protein PMAYCL1PPCAC_01076 [Pristionchus mayeri]|uniref:histone acetyltransferase n=1 Tax=Pristionchus mayeri TaxID=1317129 RepID=A0AAN4Z1L8_9BILA|nr:hypothetical protein PMAYCL1PPCAC_01076 [Pristionchus mayeri]
MGRSTAFVEPPLNGQLTARQRLQAGNNQEKIAVLDRSSLHSEWIVHVRACKIKDCSDSCSRQKKALAHVRKCRQATCDHDGMCQVTKEVLDHYKKCDKPKEHCKICIHLLKIKPAAAAAVEMALQQAVPADPVPQEPTIREERVEMRGVTKKKKKKRNYAEIDSSANNTYTDAVYGNDENSRQFPEYGINTQFTHHEPVGWQTPLSKGAVCPPTPRDSPVPWVDEVMPYYEMDDMLECMFASTFKMARMASEPVEPAASLTASASAASAAAAATASRDPPIPPETAAMLFAANWTAPSLAESMMPLLMTAPYEWQKQFIATIFTTAHPAQIKHLCGVLTPEQAETVAACSPEAAAITAFCTRLKLAQDATTTDGTPTSTSDAAPTASEPPKYSTSTSWMPEAERAKFRAMQAECALATPETPNWIRKEDRDRLMAMNFDSSPPPQADAEANEDADASTTVEAAAEASSVSAAPPTPSMTERIEALVRAQDPSAKPSFEVQPSNSSKCAAALMAAAACAAKELREMPEQLKDKVCPKEYESKMKRELDQLRIYGSYLVHARDCDPEMDCKFKNGMCGSMKEVIEHLKTCTNRQCTVHRCKEVRETVRHWAVCKNRENCVFCFHLTQTGNPIERYVSIDQMLYNEILQYSLAAQLLRISGVKDEYWITDMDLTENLASLSLEDKTDGKGRE